MANPGLFSTLKTVDTSATSLVVGGTVGGTTCAANSGLKTATVTFEALAAPSITTNKLYNIAGALYFNGSLLATGSSVAGTAQTIGMFTGAAAIGNSIITQNGGATLITVTGALTVTGVITSSTSVALTGTTNSVGTITSGVWNAGAITSSGVITSTADGVNDFTGVANSAQILRVRTTSAGTAARSVLRSLAGAVTGDMTAFSEGYTTSGANVQGSALLSGDGAGGVGIFANNALGTIKFYTGASTTARGQIDTTGALLMATQPGFLAYNSSDDATQSTGATVDFDTEVYDETGNFATDTFTAPVTGRYLLTVMVQLSTGSATQIRKINLVTTNRTYAIGRAEGVATSAITQLGGSVIADMSASNTASVQISLDTGTCTIVGAAAPTTFFSGRLLP